jgi:hypothetical protein
MCKFYAQPLVNEADDVSRSRTAAVTVDILKEYKQMIADTTSNLEDDDVLLLLYRESLFLSEPLWVCGIVL